MRVTFRGTALHDIGHLFLTDGFEHLSPELPAPAPYRPEVRSEVADRSAIRRCRLMPSAKLSPRALPSPTRRNRAQLTVRRFQSQPRGTRLIVSEKAAAKEHVFTIVGTATADDRTWRPPTQSVTLVVSAPEKETAAVAAPAK